MNYWLILNGVKTGPLTLDQVRAMHLQSTTPIWRQGLPDWVTAADIPKLRDTLTWPFAPAAARQYQQPRPEQRPRQCPPNYLAWSIVVTVLCCLIPGIVAIIYSARVETLYNRGDYEGAKSASDAAQLWIIAAVVLGLISLPLQILWALI